MDVAASLGVVDGLQMAGEDRELAENLLRRRQRAHHRPPTHDEDAVHVLLDRRVTGVDGEEGGVEPVEPGLVERTVRLCRVARGVDGEATAERDRDRLRTISDDPSSSDGPARGADGQSSGRRSGCG